MDMLFDFQSTFFQSGEMISQRILEIRSMSVTYLNHRRSRSSSLSCTFIIGRVKQVWIISFLAM